MVICLGRVHVDRLVLRTLTGTDNVLTSRELSREMSHRPHHCHVTADAAGSMHQMLIRARHSSYWDARYVRCKALRRTLHRETPGARDEQRAARGQNFISSRERSPGSRVRDTVTKTRGHVSRVTLTMSILTIRSNTSER